MRTLGKFGVPYRRGITAGEKTVKTPFRQSLFSVRKLLILLVFLVGRGDTTIEEQPEPHEIIGYSSSRLFGLFEKSAHLYQAGTSLQKIAEQMQVSKSSVRNALVEGGVRIRPYNGTPEGKAALRERRTSYANAPYGYAFLDGKLTIHPKEIQNVRRIVQLRSTGLSFNAIAKELNAKSIPPRSGKRWDHSVISEVVRRESDESLKRARREV